MSRFTLMWIGYVIGISDGCLTTAYQIHWNRWQFWIGPLVCGVVSAKLTNPGGRAR